MSSDNRAIVGYVRSTISSTKTCDVQRKMIDKYCRANNLEDCRIYCDVIHYENRRKSSTNLAQKIGIRSERWVTEYPELERLIGEILHNKIKTVLVDTELRLFCDAEHKIALEQAIEKNDVSIVVIGNIVPNNVSNTNNITKICVYHYTVGVSFSKNIVIKDIDLIYEKVSQLFYDNWEITNLYLDFGDCNRVEFNKLMQRNDIDVVITKDMYHIKRKIGAFMQVLQQLKSKKIRLFTCEDGEIDVTSEDEMINEKKEVVIYEKLNSSYELQNEDILTDKLKLFCKFKGWNICKIIVDKGSNYIKEQTFNEMLPEKANLILISSYTKLVDEVCEIKKLTQEVNLPVYSLKEGRFRIYEKEL